MTSYWKRTLDRRLSRRSALAAGAAGSAAALFLAACGGDDDSGGNGSGGKASTEDKSGLLTQAVDTSSQAKKGGTLKRSANSDPATLDANFLSASLAAYLEFVYGRLLEFKPGHLEASKDELDMDNAQSYELSPDKTTLTFKLRPGLKFHNLPPVNGRALDTEDILYSWQRFKEVAGQRGAVANEVNPSAPVLSITAPDSSTIVVKLKEPVVYITAFFAQREILNIIPKEAADKAAIDLKSRMLSTGPFQLAESDYTPSVGLTFKRHPEYWQKDVPYFDQVDYPIVPEYSAALAQFRAGGIHTYNVRQEDLLQTKNDVAELLMYENGYGISSSRMFFGWDDEHLRDERVRQAMSMAIDRNLFIDQLYNTSNFEKEGLAVTRRWSTALDAVEVLDDWWLDPVGKDFGPNAKYYQYNVEEAKKLLAAAGFPNGVEVESHHFTTTQFGPDWPGQVEIWEGMISNAGFTFKKDIFDYAGGYLKIRDTNGGFSGISYKIGPPAPTGDAVNRLGYEYTKAGGASGFMGFDVNGTGDHSGDPYVEDAVKKAQVEFDTEKRRKLVYDIQRYLAQKQYGMRWAGGATQFQLLWPAIQNVRVFQEGTSSPSITANLHWWLDTTKPPFKKA